MGEFFNTVRPISMVALWILLPKRRLVLLYSFVLNSDGKGRGGEGVLELKKKIV